METKQQTFSWIRPKLLFVHENPRPKLQLRVANYNVLKPGTPHSKTGLDWVTLASDRFPYIVRDLLPSLKADIIGLNEVTPALEAAVQEHLLSEKNAPHFICDRLPGENSHYCGLLCYLSVLEVRAVRLAGMQRQAIAVLTTKGGELFIVCTVHLMAYEEKRAIRRVQLLTLKHALCKEGEGSSQWQECVQQGRVGECEG
jgi:hypothetical protein